MSINTRLNATPTVPITHHSSRLPDVVGLGGAIAGLGGGIAMAVVGCLLALARNEDIWFAPKQIAAAFVNTPASDQPGFALLPVLAGSLVHLVISVVLGAIFGIVTRRFLKLSTSFGIPIVSGLIYGLMLWLLAYFVFFPVMNPALMQIYAPDFIIQNISYGIVLGALYSWLRP